MPDLRDGDGLRRRTLRSTLSSIPLSLAVLAYAGLIIDGSSMTFAGGAHTKGLLGISSGVSLVLAVLVWRFVLHDMPVIEPGTDRIARNEVLDRLPPIGWRETIMLIVATTFTSAVPALWGAAKLATDPSKLQHVNHLTAWLYISVGIFAWALFQTLTVRGWLKRKRHK